MTRGGLLNIDHDRLDALAHGVEQGVLRAAGLAGVAGEQQRGLLHHVLIAPLHAVGRVVDLQHGHAVALIEQAVVALPLLQRPALRLAAAGDDRLKLDVRVLFAQGEHGFGKIHVAAERHSAQKAAVAGFIRAVERAGQLELELFAARIVLARAPGQALRAMPGKAAGLFALHCPPPLFATFDLRSAEHCSATIPACSPTNGRRYNLQDQNQYILFRSTCQSPIAVL